MNAGAAAARFRLTCTGPPEEPDLASQEHVPPAEAPRLERWLAIGAAVALGLLAAARLWEVYPLVENRLAFGAGPAGRAILDLEAGEALRGLHLLDLLWLLAGPGPSPTLRTLLAAPVLAATGPSHAAESAVTILHYALLAVALAWAARSLVPREPLAAFAVAALATAAQAGLLGVAATARLEVLSALCVTAALAAWLRYRDGGDGAPIWPVALLGNCLFHASPLAGAAFTATALVFEANALPRAAFRKGVPPRLRALATWLAGPMVAWAALPPGRLGALVAGLGRESAAAPPGILGGLRLYLAALLRDGYDRPARVGIALGLAATLTAVLRVPAARRRFAPLLVFAALELAALGFGSRANFQARFVLNLVPVVALLCAAPLQLLAPLPRLLLSLPLVGLLATGVADLWTGPRLAQALEAGFSAPVVQDTCVTLSGIVPPVRGTLVNRVPDPFRQDCAMDLFFEARRQGIRLDVHRGWPARGDPEALDLSVGCRPPPPELGGFEPAGPPARVGEVCAQRYERR